jgi:hypothetical protein
MPVKKVLDQEIDLRTGKASDKKPVLGTFGTDGKESNESIANDTNNFSKKSARRRRRFR